MQRRYVLAVWVFAAISAGSGWAAAETVRLEDLDLGGMSSGWGKPQKNQSVTERPLSIGGQKFERGVGTHANSESWITLDGKTKSFTAQVGVDDNANNGGASIEFVVYGDGRELWRSGVCKWRDAPRQCRVDLNGVKILELVVTDAGDGVDFDHANWADAVFEFDGAAPKMGPPAAPAEEAVLLTPPACAEPRINGPTVYGVRPGAPFLYRIPATGQRPMTFAAAGLPDGLTLDAQTGIITGAVARAVAGRDRRTSDDQGCVERRCHGRGSSGQPGMWTPSTLARKSGRIDRERIILRSSQTALQLLRKLILEE